MSVILFASILAGCGPGAPDGVIREYVGEYVAGSPENHLHFGCRLEVPRRQAPIAQLWHFDGTRRVRHEAVVLSDFELHNLYGRNYGTGRPLWRYEYENQHGISVEFREYADGRIEPWIVFTDSARWLDVSMIDFLPHESMLSPVSPEFDAGDLVMWCTQAELLARLTEAYSGPRGPTIVRETLAKGYIRSSGSIGYTREFARSVDRRHVEQGRTIDLLPESDDEGNSIQIRLYDTVVSETEEDFLYTAVVADDPSKRYDEHGDPLAFTAKLIDVRRKRHEDGSSFLLRLTMARPPALGSEANGGRTLERR